MWQPNAQPTIESALQGWRPELTGTLVFVRQAQQVLLIEKKTGHGQGLINGPGGKLEPNESAAACAHRELYEELGVTVQQLEPAAKLRFIDQAGPQWLGYVYLAEGLVGVPTESAEARPLWRPTNALPLARMWADDAIWLPLILAGTRLEADFLLRGQTLLAHRWRPAHQPLRF